MNKSNNNVSSKQKCAQIIEQTPKMIGNSFKYVIKDDNTIMTVYQDIILQIHFSKVYSLMLITFMKYMDDEIECGQVGVINKVNFHSILGCHIVRSELPSPYFYCITQWFEVPMSRVMLFCMLVRFSEETKKGSSKLSRSIYEERRRVNEET